MNQKLKELEKISETNYNFIDLDRLVVYTMVCLDRLGIELSLENIIVGAFKLFPKKFSLLGYPEFPDATRVEKCLWRCKGNKKQWIGGKTPHGYSLNERTKIIFAETEAQLNNVTTKKERAPTRMRRKETILKDTIESPAYIKYKKEEYEKINESDFCYLLQGTLDSSKEILSENLTSIKRIAEELDNKDVKAFLIWLEHHFKDFLNKR